MKNDPKIVKSQNTFYSFVKKQPISCENDDDHTETATKFMFDPEN